MSIQTSFRPFSEIIMQYKLGYIYCYQWGNQVPTDPKVFEKNLEDEYKMFVAVFPGTPVTPDEVNAMNDLVAQYKGFYLSLLSKPLPDNPSPEFQAWYSSTH